MKIGVCCGTDLEKIKLLKKYGYDFAESHCQELAKASFEELDEIKKVGIPVLTANCFIGIRVVGKDRDEKAIKEYLSRLFEKADYLGLKYLVFGSAGARNFKDGETKEECEEDIVSFLRDFVSPLCEKYNIYIAIEPLRPEESNVINKVSEGIEIAKRTGSKYMKVLADVYHMVCQNESLEELVNYDDWLIHAHTSNPTPKDSEYRRVFPKISDEFNQADFINPLIAAGVESCSIEASTVDFEMDIKDAWEILKVYR